jgi:DNA-binding transcriptional LysR family regulator
LFVTCFSPFQVYSFAKPAGFLLHHPHPRSSQREVQVDIRRLEVFCRVLELKSFTRAAEAVLLTQPTVSENIRLLEETVGERLLDRLGREVLPTPAGRILYGYARRIIQLRDEALQAMRQYGGDLSGTLALGASTIPGAYILPSLIESFRLDHPAIQLQLRIGDTAAVVEELLHDRLELGLIGARLKERRFDCDEAFADELVLTLYPGHFWAGRRSVRPEELESEPFILREQGSGTRLVMSQVLREHGVDPAKLRVVAEMGSSEAVRQGIKSRLGISILSSLAVAEDLRRGDLVTVPLEGMCIRRPFYLVRRKGRQLSPLALAFYEHLRRAGTG